MPQVCSLVKKETLAQENFAKFLRTPPVAASLLEIRKRLAFWVIFKRFQLSKYIKNNYNLIVFWFCFIWGVSFFSLCVKQIHNIYRLYIICFIYHSLQRYLIVFELFYNTLTATSILAVIGRVYRYQFKCNYRKNLKLFINFLLHFFNLH